MNLQRSLLTTAALLTICLPLFAFRGRAGETPATVPHDWDRIAAAKYLDARQTWWMGWERTRRDHATACVSCHTAVPYAMSRPALRGDLKETAPSAPERQMLSYVARRVTLWNELQPFYNDEKFGVGKAVESFGTESVMNALILSRYDSASGHMTELTRQAFKNMWAKQLTAGDNAGSWEWLNFKNAPWESNESHYYGTALAAVAVGLAPEGYARTPDIQAGIAAMREYLSKNYAAQPVANKLVVLWASRGVPGLLTSAQRQELLKELAKTQREDGGWSLADLGQWTKRRDDTPFEPKSDGYATGLAVFTLKQAGISASQPMMKRGVTWLMTNQSAADGRWPAYSLNKQRDLQTDIGRLMSDAATSYAVLALEAVKR